MNQQNAEAKGKSDGQEYQRQQRGIASIYGENSYFLPKGEYERQGKIKAYTEIRSSKTRVCYCKGWNSVWEGE